MQFHANNEQLITYRNQELLDASIHQHIESCDKCLEQVNELKDIACLLKNDVLDDLSESDLSANWEIISESLYQHQKAKSKKPIWFAIAASSVFALLLGSQLLNQHLPVEHSAELESNNSEKSVRLTNSPKTEQLVAYSRLIEDRLQALPKPRIVRANTAGTISNLQDHISLLDTRLSMQHQSPLTEQQKNALWQQRVKSMNSLYQVRAAQLQRVSY